MARVDPSIIRQLFADGMEAAVDVAPVYPGEPDPEDEGHWARLVSLDVRGLPRVSRAAGAGVQPDLARIVAVVSVCSSVAACDPASGGGAWAHGAAVNRVALALDGKTFLDDDTTHKLELFRTDIREEQNPPAEQRAARWSTITVEGLAQRRTGAGLSNAAAQGL